MKKYVILLMIVGILLTCRGIYGHMEYEKHKRRDIRCEYITEISVNKEKLGAPTSADADDGWFYYIKDEQEFAEFRKQLDIADIAFDFANHYMVVTIGRKLDFLCYRKIKGDTTDDAYEAEYGYDMDKKAKKGTGYVYAIEQIPLDLN